MRDILKKATTAAMIAGAALFVTACGEDAETNEVNAVDLNDSAYDTNLGDMDMNAMDMNAMDSGVENALDNAAAATDNAAEAIDNAQEAAQ